MEYSLVVNYRYHFELIASLGGVALEATFSIGISCVVEGASYGYSGATSVDSSRKVSRRSPRLMETSPEVLRVEVGVSGVGTYEGAVYVSSTAANIASKALKRCFRALPSTV